MALIGVLTALLCLDEWTLTGIFCQPVFACCLFGAALGCDAVQALQLGIGLQIVALAYDKRTNSYGHVSGSVLGSLTGTAALAAGTASAETVGLFGFVLGLCVNRAVMLLATALLKPARKAAADRNAKKLYQLNWIPVLIAMAAHIGLGLSLAKVSSSLANYTLENLNVWERWAAFFLRDAGILVPCAGLAVLLRNMDGKELSLVAVAGFACAASLIATNAASAALALCGGIALGIAVITYHSGPKADNSASVKGGAQKWW